MYDLPSARGPGPEGRVFVCLSLDPILERGDSVSKSLEPHGSTGFARSLTAPYLETCFTNKDASLNRGSATIFPVNPEEVLGVLWLSTPPDPKGISNCQLLHRPCRLYAVHMVQRRVQGDRSLRSSSGGRQLFFNACCLGSIEAAHNQGYFRVRAGRTATIASSSRSLMLLWGQWKHSELSGVSVDPRALSGVGRGLPRPGRRGCPANLLWSKRKRSCAGFVRMPNSQGLESDSIV